MIEPRHRLFQIRNMPSRYRPHDKMRCLGLLKPFALAVVDLLVDRRPDEALQRFDTLPNRQIDRHGWVARRTHGGCIVAVVLEAPHESFAALRESIDAIEIHHERRHARIVRRISEPAYVELGDVARHTLLRRHSQRLAVRIGGILIDTPLDLWAEMGDEPLDRPGRGVTESADGVPFDLLGDVEQHVNFTLLRAARDHTLHDAPHPSGAFATGRALTTALVLVKIR